MSFEKNFITAENKVNQMSDQSVVILGQQIDEAVKQEDYEQAAVLRDLMELKKTKGDLFEFKKKDFIEPTQGGIYIFRKENPRHRAWKGIHEKQQTIYWEGSDRISSHEFSEELTSGLRTFSILGNDGWEKVRALKNSRGGEKVDFMLTIQRRRDEMKDIVDLSEEKFNSLWLPYCKRNGLLGLEYKELHSTYDDFDITDTKQENLNKIPRDIRDPLDYWQKVYDNSRSILDDLNNALDELR